MSFESFEAPKIVPDAEQAEVWEKVREYFEEVLKGGRGELEEERTEVSNIISCLKKDDFEPASLYLENEMRRLQNNIVAMREVGDRSQSLWEAELSRVQELYASLKLEEK